MPSSSFLLLASLAAAGAKITPVWGTGAGTWLAPCARVTKIFDIPICLTTATWNICSSDPTKCNHIANVVAQLMDNDADGKVDDAAVHKHMKDNKYFIITPATDADSESETNMPNEGKSQMSGLWEAVPNCCDVPANRGASQTDRSTWAAAIGTTAGCNTQRGATTEEVLHLITEAAAALYPAKWGGSYSSTAGAAVQATNGNCGWGYSGNYQNPSTSSCVGQYAYDDSTCDARCIVVEGIYWAIVSYIGGLYTSDRASSVSQEWLMCTPDDGMTIVPSGVSNAATLQSGSAALFALVGDSTSDGNKWIPAIMPDGAYAGNATKATAGSGGAAPSGPSGPSSPSSPSTPSAGNPCFPSTAVVTVARDDQHRTRVPIAKLRSGDRIAAVKADGSLTLDTVSLFSIANADATASFLTLRTATNISLTLTPAHRIAVGPKCCSTLKSAEDVQVGETIWTMAGGKAARGGTKRALPQRLHSKTVTTADGLYSPVLVNGGFPIVDEVVTSFDSVETVHLASHSLPYLEALCTSSRYGAASLCSMVHRVMDTFTGKVYKHIVPKNS